MVSKKRHKSKISKAEATRRRITEAALALFLDKNFEQTTMRDIAKKAEVALGATYYYFKSKDDIVMEFYRDLQDKSSHDCDKICADTSDFEERVLGILNAKFRQFKPYRHFLNILFRSAGDPTHPLSPFSAETKGIREEAIGLFEKCLKGSNVKVSDDFRPHLPRLLWYYQMGLILYWIHDASASQVKTHHMMERSFKLISQLLNLSRLPFIGGIRKNILNLLQVGEIDPKEEEAPRFFTDE